MSSIRSNLLPALWIGLCLLGLFVLPFSAQPAENRAFVRVSGTVNGTSGAPIVGAIVLIMPDCPGCPLDVIETTSTNEAGEFRLTIFAENPHYLFIEAPAPPDYLELLSSSQHTIRHLPGYSGVKIDMDRSRSVDLGVIRPTVEHLETTFRGIGPADGDFAKLLGGGEVRVQMLDNKGRPVEQAAHADRRFIEDGKAIKLAVPRGTWRVRFAAWNNGRILSSRIYKVKAVSADDITWMRVGRR